jgi:hypothetical protein
MSRKWFVASHWYDNSLQPVRLGFCNFRQADKKVYFVDYESQADLKVYFVKYESQAGWKNNSKKQLMY